jgi:hypothetical protein
MNCARRLGLGHFRVLSAIRFYIKARLTKLKEKRPTHKKPILPLLDGRNQNRNSVTDVLNQKCYRCLDCAATP